MSKHYYDKLVYSVNKYLAHKYPKVTTETDIFEHALLRVLGFKFVPEKCLFMKPEQDNGVDRIMIHLRTPNDMDVSQFREHLEKAIQSHPINIINSQDNDYVLALDILPEFIEDKFSEVCLNINAILNEKKEFYEYWTNYSQKNSMSLTMVLLKNKIKKFFNASPLSLENEIWSKIVTKISKSKNDLKVISWHAFNDVERWPQIQFLCKDTEGKKQSLTLSRHKIINIMETNFSDIKKDLEVNKELIVPSDMNQFTKNLLGNREFKMSDGHYSIDLAYHPQYGKSLLNKYKIEYTTHSPTEDDMPGRGYFYHIFDRNNYIKYCLALKESSGHSCMEERSHQLMYYYKKEEWSKLEQTLRFLLNIEIEKVDYTDLLFYLFEEVKEKFSNELFDIVDDTLQYITKNKENLFTVEQIEKANSALVEVIQIRMNAVPYNYKDASEQKAQQNKLKNELFCAAHGARNSVLANRLLAEISGQGLGQTFKSDAIMETPLLLIECAEKIKILTEQLKARPDSSLVQFSLFQSTQPETLVSPRPTMPRSC
ncbi:hypothetical protein [Legionella sp.]|uniref:hypothetical protein n=1 Tax=Legionella sp. TaxID=459 RepID=UPI003C81EC28